MKLNIHDNLMDELKLNSINVNGTIKIIGRAIINEYVK